MEKQKYNILLLDDKPKSLVYLMKMISEVSFIGNTTVLSDLNECLQSIDEMDIDILFLDMDFGDVDLDGNTWLSMLTDPPVTVACSSYSNYVYSSREVGIKYFIGKTPSFRVLEELLKDVVIEVDRKAEKLKREVKQLEIKDVSGEEVIIQVQDILYALINNNILTIYLELDAVVTQMSLKSFASMLPVDKFAKPHNSYLIALDKIEVVRGKQIFLKNKSEDRKGDQSLHITQEFAKEFRHKYEIFKQNN
ncbi:LytR/AlgR family response regulator transcription factor [Sphingobacterium bovistauri]|uniref:LytTR family transcriptional regulator DNA-binding domain-containing protein n=1 Tax=Sphingobacterium bovistauri TaxID=2781959 RepID=A0ABS7Z7J4_9SPHI|nr:LytTR family transcriptional regulator DNA-binding domain-containing protein [Sphingobacterium bovistauri]MCA5006125.1 LytTR family transcriptional regulator DNA-binding domain-containing protein [Sphingobacterium bovistauri]